MYQKIKGVVLHSLKFNDTSNIVDLYTDQIGRTSFIMKVSHSKKNGVQSVLFQPLALIEVEADIRPNNNLHKIREAKSLFPFNSLPYHPYKSSIAMFLAEFLYRALKEEAPNEALFAYLLYSIRWLDECENRSFANFHLVFLMRLSRFLGLYPNVDDYTSNCYFDMLNACFTPLLPKSGAFLKPDEAARIRLLLRMNYETMHLFAMSRAERNRCLTVINDYYRLHIPDFPILKSLDVLKELFD
ncbi:MAG: DNA repair protein RecO [Bacteroides sp.]|nr:DNA repair protein RecO [Bacteroides sp.]